MVIKWLSMLSSFISVQDEKNLKSSNKKILISNPMLKIRVYMLLRKFTKLGKL
jgi:hypothetical protein